jgi:hypothetical protein
VINKRRRLAELITAIKEKTINQPQYVGHDWDIIEKEKDSFLGLQDKENLEKGSFFFQHSFLPTWVDVRTQTIVDTVGQKGSTQVLLPTAADVYLAIKGLAGGVLSNGKRTLLLMSNANAAKAMAAQLKNTAFGSHIRSLVDEAEPVAVSWPPLAAAKKGLSVNLTRLLRASALQQSQWAAAAELYYSPLAGESNFGEAVAARNRLAAQYVGENINTLSAVLPKNTNDLAQICKEGEKLWEKVGDKVAQKNAEKNAEKNPKKSIFERLNPRFFARPDGRALSAELQPVFERMLAAVSTAQRDVWTYLYQYEKQLEQHYAECYANKLGLIARIRENCKQLKKQSKIPNKKIALGDDLADDKKTSWFGFGQENPEAEILFIEIHIDYERLHDLQLQYMYVAYTLNDIADKDTPVKELLAALDSYETACALWYRTIEEQVQAHLEDLNPNHLHRQGEGWEQMQSAILGLQLLSKNIEKSQLLVAPPRLDKLSLQAQLAVLATLEADLTAMLAAWPQFVDYHAAAYFMASQTAELRTWLATLQAQQKSDWAGISQYLILEKEIAARQQLPAWRDNTGLARLIANIEKDSHDYRPELLTFIDNLAKEKNYSHSIYIATPAELSRLPCQLAMFDLLILPFGDEEKAVDILPARFRSQYCVSFAQNKETPLSSDLQISDSFWAYQKADSNVFCLDLRAALPNLQPKRSQEYGEKLKSQHPTLQISYNKILENQYLSVAVPVYIEGDGDKPKAIFFLPISGEAAQSYYGWETSIVACFGESVEIIFER